MSWLALDDTDHLGGGCTTYSMFELIRNLPSGYTIEEYRLVRLYPFASRRTRGNAAVAVKIVGNDYAELIDFLEQWWINELLPLQGKITESEQYNRPQSPTDPGMVWFNQRPDEEFYWQCVQNEITMEKIPTADKSWGGHGRIGATAAIAWPAKSYTFEAISWRKQDSVNQSSKRQVDLNLLSIIDEDPNNFMSRDLRSNSVLISPRGNCPVLFGLRSRTYESAKTSCEQLLQSPNTEEVEGYVVFKTNQATDDHLNDDMDGIVGNIQLKKRGTVKITCTNGQDLMAFSESGDVKNLAQWLKSGDKIQFNGLTNDDGAIHLEKLRVIESTPEQRRPKCVPCNVTLKSMGKNQPLRCPKCREKFTQSWEYVKREPPFEDWVQPPADSRRHLSMPLTW